MSGHWPADWTARVTGESCEMCESRRPDEDNYGIRILATADVDAVLQRADIQRGYTLVIWRGRHVIEPYELTEHEAARYWTAVSAVGKALADYYRPLKMNYETLGNTVPHLHTHILPRFRNDPAPGRPFPLLPQDGSEPRLDAHALGTDATELRRILAR